MTREQFLAATAWVRAMVRFAVAAERGFGTAGRQTMREEAVAHKALLAAFGFAEPCGECHLKPGEACNICGATRPAQDTPEAANAWGDKIRAEGLANGSLATCKSCGRTFAIAVGHDCPGLGAATPELDVWGDVKRKPKWPEEM